MLSSIYQTPLALLTDLYQLTMSYGYFKANQHQKQAVFHLFFRKNPFKGSFTVAAGLDYAIDYIQNLQFAPSDLAYLETLRGNNNQPLFDADFLHFLSDYRFKGNIMGVAEGTVVFPHQPLLRIEADLLSCQLLETPLLNLLNFQSLIATKAAQVAFAAQSNSVLEFGLRRAQGVDGALAASRAAFIGGCDATSNVLAGKLFGIPVRGTHAHSWVMSFDTELEAFEQYAAAMPNNCVFLVDTYNTLEGVQKAIKVGLQLKERGFEMIGIRLDSGDLASLSIAARAALDAAGLTNALIVASNDLDEYEIARLKANGAPIAIWGVGTRLVTAYDQPALGGVYKLGAIQNAKTGNWDYKIKLSEDPIKTSNPGKIGVVRAFDAMGQPLGDLLYNELMGKAQLQGISYQNEPINLTTTTHHTQQLLQSIFNNGHCCYARPALTEIKQYAQQQIELFANVPTPYPTGLDAQLYALKQALIKEKQ